MPPEQPQSGDYAVLFVDDEQQALKYFERAFAKDFPIRTAASAADARRILEEEGDRIGVLVADQRMPGETGVELLSDVRQQRPGIVRILTTAYSDLDNAIEAVNSGAVFRYVAKPWDLRDLRGVLLRAMEFFMVQKERDILLREKLHVLQRMIVLDRVRSFTVLAASLAGRMRNSMVALKAFLDRAPLPGPGDGAGGDVGWVDLWTLAQEESQRLIDNIEELFGGNLSQERGLSEVMDLAELLRREGRAEASTAGGTAIAAELAVPDDLPPVKGDPEMVRRLVGVLKRRTAEQSNGAAVRIAAEPVDSVNGAPGVRVRFIADAEGWSPQAVAALFAALQPDGAGTGEMGMDMLAAFFLAYHHGGDLRVHTSPPDGPGFELLLPLDPEAPSPPKLESDWLERVFTNLESWQAVDSGP